jgi:hypothetical protein
VYIETNRILNQKQTDLVPVDEILRLDQRRLIHDARTHLPLWKSIPVIGRMGVFFNRLWRKFVKGASSLKDPSEVYASFTKTREKPRRGTAAETNSSRTQQTAGSRVQSAPATETASEEKETSAPEKERASGAGSKVRPSAEQKEAMRKALNSLKESYLGKRGNIDEELRSLIEKWNPLVAEQSKKNLIEDVNSAIRDYLRKLKRSLYTTPPDEERIKKLSAKVAEYEGFERIRNKQAFRRYIELYMIKILGKNL